MNNSSRQAGRVVAIFSGIARLDGPESVSIHEILSTEDGEPAGIVIGFDERFVDILLFDDEFNQEQPLFPTNKTFQIPVSDKITGRIINGIGEPIDGFAALSGEPREVFAQAPEIIKRHPVDTPLTTGIKVIDSTLPLGRGQRELIIGDRKLGKSTVAQDVIINQKNISSPVYCIYVLCGQPEQKLKRLISLFTEESALNYTTIVAASAGSSFAELYLCVQIGCVIGEYFRDKGEDALIVYDDLSQHARAYRDISLLLGRAPGREAYPGDIFSLHASLLERSARLSKTNGGGSLTALPIIETQEGDITGFIPTNLISITDGQIYFDQGLYQKRFLPAINIELSVSRVGSQAQPPVMREVTKHLRLTLAQQRELKKLSLLETSVSKISQVKLRRGDLLLELLKQDKHTRVDWPEQTILFYAVNEGLLDDLTPRVWIDLHDLFLDNIRTYQKPLLEKISQGHFTDTEKEQVKKAVQQFKEEFVKSYA
jgi:F-type H+-transporting ATPase subunit alpha